MKPRILILLLAICSLFVMNAPADAVIVVFGSQLGRDCYLTAKAGIDLKYGIQTCTAALKNDPLDLHDRAGTYVNRGVLEAAMHQVDDALSDYNTSISIMPDLGDAYLNRAGIFIWQKHFDQAIADANHGLELGSDRPYVGYYNRALAEERLGQFKPAYQDYQKTLELEPKYAPAAERLQDFVVTKQ
jgi:tetratricopeptide (TPR) repeat protein